ncbi:MAG: hypothetical protein ABSA96_05835 [Candidatus Acidiferrales bacterium]
MRSAKSIGRVFQCLPGMLLACLVVFFAVMRGSYTVGMCCQFMKLRGSPMRVLRHGTSFQSMLARRL